MGWRGCLWLIAGTLACNVLLSAVSAAQTSSCKPEPSDDFFNLVALGISDQKLILATPMNRCVWRYRVLKLSSDEQRILDASLSITGTKVAVLFSNDHHYLFDLTVPGPLLITAVHNLPGQTYGLCGPDGNLVLLDDHNNSLQDNIANQCQQSTPVHIFDELENAQRLENSLDDIWLDENISYWKLSNLVPDQHLYAPVLEFAKEEKVFPSSTAIWDPLVREAQPYSLDWDRQPASSRPQDLLLIKYLTSSLQNSDQSVYYRTESFPGSWLFEYWTYYSFDVGGVKPHPHDTEHVFVEVDKLGGRIVSVLAQAHTDVSPNNLYSALIPAAEPSSLPIFVFVERGKHAIAPDINHDGTFTPGIDVNVFSEESQVWGVRDAIGESDAHISSHSSSMMLPRELKNAWAEETLDGYFEYNTLLHPIVSRYRLLPFPGTPHPVTPLSSPCRANKLTQACAIYELETHVDAQNPKHIYKKWVFPSQELRFGYANIEGGNSVSIGYVHSVNDLPGFKRWSGVPIPGRIAFEVFALPFAVLKAQEFSGISPFTPTVFTQGVRLQYGVQYEKSISNLFGYFGGYFRREFFTPFCPTHTCSITSPLPGNFYQVGMYLEVPMAKTNVTFHLGPVFSTPGGTAGVYFRISYGIWSRRGRTTFGNPEFADDRRSRP